MILILKITRELKCSTKFDQLIVKSKEKNYAKIHIKNDKFAITMFWKADSDGFLKINQKKYFFFRPNTILIWTIDLEAEFRNKGHFSNLLRYIASHEKVKHITIVDASTDAIQNLLSKIEINGRKFFVENTEYTWCRKGICHSPGMGNPDDEDECFVESRSTL